MKRTPRRKPAPVPELFYELRLIDEAADWHIMPIVRSKSRLEVLNLLCDFDGYKEARDEQKPLYCGDNLRVEMVAIVGPHAIVLTEQAVAEIAAIDEENA